MPESPQPALAVRRPSSVRRSLLLLLLALALAGCGPGTSDRGTILGSFTQVGGPALLVGGRPMQPKPVPLPGQVVARSAAGVSTVTVGKTGRFRMLLPPGTYRLTGYSPMYPGSCAGEGAIKVRTGKYVTRVNIICVAA